jgi:hypothetical protein
LGENRAQLTVWRGMPNPFCRRLYPGPHLLGSGHLYAGCRSVRKQVTPELCPTIF